MAFCRLRKGPTDASTASVGPFLGDGDYLTYPLERYHLTPALLRRVRRLRFRFGCGRFHEAADLFRRTSLHIVGNVRIGVEGEPSAVVAQHTGQRFHIHAAGEGHGSESMAQIWICQALTNRI